MYVHVRSLTHVVQKVGRIRWNSKGSVAGKSENPGPIEMDTHNDTNNEYIHEDIWKLFVRWFSVAPSHQLDRRHLYFKGRA